MNRKFIALATAAMCMAGSANSVFAASRFADINDVPWNGAQQYIDEAAALGLISGYNENGKLLCKSKNPVTYTEAVQLAYSIMCSYNSANRTSSTVIAKWTPVMQNANIPSWAYESVSYALENSIVTANDLRLFINSKGVQNNAKREDVGVIFGKTLSRMYAVNPNAVPPYADNAQISKTSYPYLELLNRLNLMIGDAGMFNPKRTMNRAEMAVLSTKTFKEIKKGGNNNVNPDVTEQLVGKVTKISGSEITIKTDKSEKTVKVASSAKIIYNGKDGRFSDIRVNDNAVVVVTNGSATFMNIYPSNSPVEKDEIESGVITSISKTRITIENNKKKATYKFDRDYNDIDVTIDGNSRKDVDDLIKLFDDSRDDITAELKVDKDGYVTKITASTESTKGLEGLLTHLSRSTITIKNNGKEYEYDLLRNTDDIKVIYDDSSSNFEKLRDRYNDDEEITVKLTLNSRKEVTKITAEKGDKTTSSTSVTGKLGRISSSRITVERSSGSSKSYDIDRNTDVTIDGSSSSVSRLISKVDDGYEYDVKLTLKGSKVTKIAASLNNEKDRPSGRIESVSSYDIEIRLSDGKYKTYDFARSCDFTIDGRYKDIDDVKALYRNGSSSAKAYITLDGAGNAKKVEIKTSNTKVNEKEGTVESISKDTIKIRLSDDSTKRYDLDRDVDVYVDRDSTTLSRFIKRVNDGEKFTVELTVSSDEVTKIKASKAKEDVKGYIIGGDKDTIRISDKKPSGGSISGHGYDVSPSVTVIVDGDEYKNSYEDFINSAGIGDYEATLIRNSQYVTKIIAKSTRR